MAELRFTPAVDPICKGAANPSTAELNDHRRLTQHPLTASLTVSEAHHGVPHTRL